MIDILNFIFASWGHFIGTCALMWLAAIIVSAFGPFVTINRIDHTDKDL